MPERYLSIDSYANRMDVSRSTVKRWIQKNIITVRRLRSGRVRIPASQLDRAFIPEYKPSSQSGAPKSFDINRLVAEVQSRGSQITNRQEV